MIVSLENLTVNQDYLHVCYSTVYITFDIRKTNLDEFAFKLLYVTACLQLELFCLKGYGLHLALNSYCDNKVVAIHACNLDPSLAVSCCLLNNNNKTLHHLNQPYKGI